MATLSSIEKKLQNAASDIAKELEFYSLTKMQEQIDNYYTETPSYFPRSYKPTEAFKKNTLKSKNIGETTCLIYFVPQSYRWQGFDSDKILDWNLHGRHGGHYDGADVWETGTDAIREKYKDIAAGVLKRKGIPFE